MMTITRKLEFDAGHRVMNHESKCATLHGHRYVVEVTATADNLDSIGRIIDFSVLKAKIGEWIDLHWDHTTIVFEQDLATIQGLHMCPSFKSIWISPWNPTAENMADYLLRSVCPKVLEGTGVAVIALKLYETPNCWAEVFL